VRVCVCVCVCVCVALCWQECVRAMQIIWLSRDGVCQLPGESHYLPYLLLTYW